MLTHAEIHKKIDLIIQGITSRENQAVFTSRGKRHYMDNWDWFQGVALFGLYEYYRDSGEQAVLNYLLDWFDKHIAEGGIPKNVNSMSPFLTLSYLYEITGKAQYLEMCKEWADYAMVELPRTEEGGFQHVTIDSDNYMQLWDDTLYVLALYMGRMGMLLNREDYIQESVRQFLVHLKYLTDTSTGLFFHGFNFVGRHHYAGALWGRGNAWYTAGLVDYLDMVTLSDGVKMFLIGSLETQIKALRKFQDESGMWHMISAY